MSLVLMFAMMFNGLSQTGGEFGPGALIGWPNRLPVVAYCGWMMTADWIGLVFLYGSSFEQVR